MLNFYQFSCLLQGEKLHENYDLKPLEFDDMARYATPPDYDPTADCMKIQDMNLNNVQTAKNPGLMQKLDKPFTVGVRRNYTDEEFAKMCGIRSYRSSR